MTRQGDENMHHVTIAEKLVLIGMVFLAVFGVASGFFIMQILGVGLF